jgi:hypothetical protein
MNVFRAALFSWWRQRPMSDGKSSQYEAEAEKCRRLAADEACADAREYYEALRRDYIKLAAKARQETSARGDVS